MRATRLAANAGGIKAVSPSGSGYNVTDFGATGDGVTDDTLAFMRAFNAGDTIDLPPGIYRVDLDALPTQRPIIRGAGPSQTFLQPFTSGGAALTLGTDATWEYGEIRDLSFIGAAGTNVDIGVSFGHAVYATNDQYAGRMRFVNVGFDDLLYGVLKRYGNIGNKFLNCSFADCSYHYHAESYASMHAGNDLFDGCHFQEAALASIYIDSSLDGTGQTVFRGCIWELNAGFPLFVQAYQNTGTIGLLLEDCWGELNATTTPTAIHGSSYTTRFAYLRNVRSAHFERVMTNGQRVELVGYTTLTNNDGIVGDIDSPIVQEAGSVYVADNLSGDDIRVHPYTRFIKRVKRTSGNFLGHCVVPQRVKISHKYAAALRHSDTGQNVRAWQTAGNSAVVADGLLFDACQEIVLGTNTYALSGVASFNLTEGKFIAWTFEVQWVSGNAPRAIGFIGVQRSVGEVLVMGEWATFGGMGEVVAGGHTGATFSAQGPSAATATLRFGAQQMLEFDTRQEAIEFLDAKVFAVDQAELGRIAWGTAAPTAGTWAVGDKVTNTAPSAGGTKEWVCTTAGSPGTWTANTGSGAASVGGMYAQLARGSDQVISNLTQTSIAWTTDTSDVYGWHAANAPEIIPTTAGWYLVMAQVMWDTAAGGDNRMVEIALNGALSTMGRQEELASTILFTQRTQTYLHCNGSSDEITIEVTQGSGGSLSVKQTYTIVQVILLAAD